MKTNRLTIILIYCLLNVYVGIIAAFGQAVTRKPYLQIGTSTSIVIKWRTDLPTDSKVNIGLSSTQLTSFFLDAANTTEHEIKVSNLSPNTVYYYNVGSTNGVLAGDNSYFFKTAPTVGSTQPIRIWAMGDMGHAGDTPDNQKNVRDSYLKYIGNDNRQTDVVLLLGDNAYPNGMDNEYQVNFFEPYQNHFLKNNVLWPVPGNHEYYAASRNSRDIPYYSIFTLPKNAEAGGVASKVESYYSFDFANVHFIALDSDGIEDNQYRLYDTISPQVNWLKRDLATNRQKWTIVMFHHPPHTKNSHDSDAEVELWLLKENLTPILERYKVDMVLNAHSHIYERSKYLRSGFTGPSNTFLEAKNALSGSNGRYDGAANSCAYIKKNEGIIYATVGSSGRNNGVPGPWHPMSAFADQTTGGSLVLEIENNRLDGKWIASTGVIKDQFTVFKDVNKQTNVSANYGTSVKLSPSWKGTYNWPDGSKGATFSPTITKDITIEVRDDQSCLSDQFIVRALAVPTITTTNLTNPSVCLGTVAPVAFTTSGFTTTGRMFSVQLSDLNGNFTAPTVVGTGSASPISATIPTTATLGFQYRLRVVADSLGITSVPSSAIVLMKKPTATLTGGATINVGDSTVLNIAFTGNGPWTYTFTNTNTGTTSANPLMGSVKPTVTTTYTLASVSNICGLGTVSGSATVTVTPKISTAALAIGNACVGTNVSVPFVVTGAFASTVTYTAQLSDAVGDFTNPTIIGTGSASPIAATLPLTLAGGVGYRVRVIANLTATYINSPAFSVRVKPTATLSGGATINVGDSTNLNIAFTGNSPWTYTFTNTNTGTTSANPFIGSVKPTVTTTYTLASVSNICGSGTVSGSATVTVTPRISTAALAIGSACVGTNVSVPFAVTGVFASAATFTAQLSDAAGSFTNPTVIGTGTVSPIVATLPLTSVAGVGYQIRVIASLTATTVNSVPFTIKVKPTATIGGATTINVDATANLTINFTGDAPWTYLLSDGTTATVSVATSTVAVKPTVSTTYSITSLTNSCGVGAVSGSVKITVIPRISAATLSLGNVCVGSPISVPFTLIGAFETPPTYTVQLSDNVGSFANPVVIGTGTVSPIAATIPANTVSGSYGVRVVSSGSTSVGSLAFNIRPLPTATIAGNQTINFGDAAVLSCTFSGDAPWKYTLSDGTTGTADRSPFVINIKSDQTKTYTISKVNNICGDGTSSGSAAVVVIPRLVTENLPSFICAGSTIDIKYGVGGVLSTNTSYQVQLSDSAGRFNNPIVIGTGTASPISSVIPANTISGNNYRLKVVAVNNNTNTTPSSTFIVRTKAVGVLTGGGITIKPNEEAVLVIQATGDGPWNYVLSDNTTGTSAVSPIIISVFPIYPTTYTIKSISNTCGVGVGSGAAVVNVLITSLDNSFNDVIIIYPNPTQTTVNLNIKLTQPQDGEWSLFNETGQILGSQKWSKTQSYEELFSIENMPSGKYLLKIRTGQNWTIRKLIKN
jgi:acid phosphatase type 7